jgi:cytochrome c5
MIRRACLLALSVAAAAACGATKEHDAPATEAAPLGLGPCRDGDANEQRYGSTCLCCHSDEFGVGGSIDRSGPPVARIVVVDAVGDVADVAPNAFGNFFRHFPMTPPVRAAAIGPDGRRIEMQSAAPSADCNRCHSASGSAPPIHGPS